MRIVATALLFSSLTGAALAQTPDWSGPYVGVVVSSGASSDGDAKATIDPGLVNWRASQPPPPTLSHDGTALDGEISPGLYAGWRHTMGSLVFGIEGQIEEGGPSTQFDNGSGIRSIPDPTTACDLRYNPFPNVVGGTCLIDSRDEITADIEIERQAALRFSLGMPVGDRLLLSAYAGPALAWGSLDLSQTTITRSGQLCTRFCGISPIQNDEETSLTEGRIVDDKVWGVVAGLTADFKLSDRVIARADVGYRRFEALRGTTGGTNGADSEVWAQQAGFTAGLGISVRF